MIESRGDLTKNDIGVDLESHLKVISDRPVNHVVCVTKLQHILLYEMNFNGRTDITGKQLVLLL